MPWTAADAKRHNSKMNTPAKQSKWAKIANGVLKSELAKGTSQAKAEGIAIATANKRA